MPELEDDGPGRTCRDSPTSPQPDLELDVYSPWPMMDHQLPFTASPLVLSASDQPNSPLWAFSCGFKDKLAAAPGGRGGGGVGGVRLSDCSLSLSHVSLEFVRICSLLVSSRVCADHD
ncbi:hypothetical protein EUGRSUZ_E00727 [Eucalyptus grandis]|uniref:Uncharacterized protein n=2 Tax=Eucalyptus grandis TaxID=71139 RepID=A0ACC3KTG0_EUCGR|nr:hypothetical protein EUGRSUZ_E00727 [Eucalyptus grandis]